MASCLGVGVSLFGASDKRNRYPWRVQIRSEGGASADSVSAVVNGASLVGKKEGNWSSIDKGNGVLKAVEKKIKLRDDVSEMLEPFWDDGYGTVTMQDYFAASEDFTQHPDGGPPRWFCPVASGTPLKGSPILFFLPGKYFAEADKFKTLEIGVFGFCVCKTNFKFKNMEWLNIENWGIGKWYVVIWGYK